MPPMVRSPLTSLILASSSPRRRELLAGCGIVFEAAVPDADEEPLPGEEPKQLVERLSLAKAASVAEHRPQAWVIGADTVVVLEGEILGKPANEKEAAAMLAKLQGRKHQVFGGLAVINRTLQIQRVDCSISRVRFMPLSPAAIRSYVGSGEPMDKAGAYAIQGLGAALVAEVSGSYSNVVGLDLEMLIALLRDLGCEAGWLQQNG